jgi:hypothetical protein
VQTLEVLFPRPPLQPESQDKEMQVGAAGRTALPDLAEQD